MKNTSQNYDVFSLFSIPRSEGAIDLVGGVGKSFASRHSK